MALFKWVEMTRCDKVSLGPKDKKIKTNSQKSDEVGSIVEQANNEVIHGFGDVFLTLGCAVLEVMLSLTEQFLVPM